MKRKDIEKAAINYDSRLVAFKAFMKGADWRINSVWHYDKYSPMLNKPFLFVCHKGAIALQLKREEDWDLLVKDRICVKWAYIEDLIPTN